MVSKAVKIGIAVTAGVVTLTIIIVISVLAAPAKSDTGTLNCGIQVQCEIGAM